MPPRRTTPPDRALSHLKKCPKCPSYVGAPQMCTGQKDDRNEGYYYEKCLNNRPPVTDSCLHFRWRRDLGRGKSARTKEPCPGELCKAGGKRTSVNHECTFGVCLRCCKHLQPLLSIPLRCAVSDHRKGVETKVSTKGKSPDPEPRRRGRAAKSKGKSVVSESSVEEPDSDDCEIVAPPKGRPPAKRESFATPVSPPYVARVFHIDAESVLQSERVASREREAYARSRTEEVTIKWWTKDGGEPDILAIDVDNPMAFHPKDIPLLVKRYRCDVEEFQYYDSKKAVWYTGQAGTASRDISKMKGQDLCFRGCGITQGAGMPGPQKKRAAPEDSPLEPETPRRPQPPGFRGYPMTPTSDARRAFSPATTPPGSGSSAWRGETDPDDWNTPRQPVGCPTEHPDSFSAINDRAPPIPALFAEPQAVLEAGPSSHTASPAVRDPSPDLSKAPRRHRAWPLKYASDMALGFQRIRALEDGYPPMTVGDAFVAVFDTVYKYSTFREQHRAWLAAGEVPGEQERWIAYGRTPQGEWAKFMRKWRVKK